MASWCEVDHKTTKKPPLLILKIKGDFLPDMYHHSANKSSSERSVIFPELREMERFVEVEIDNT